jgi:cysteine desulfurase
MFYDLEHINKCYERFYKKLKNNLEYIYVNGDEKERYKGNLNISFAFVEGESLMMAIKDIAVSSGSACTSASLEPSYVLHALGIKDDLAHSSLRIGFGRFTTFEEVDYAADLIIKAVNKLRNISPLWEMKKQGMDLNKVNWAAH